jgi:tetratricopeptide (TPR) repeat protein
MSAAAEHAQALIDRSRWDLAERALEAALADDPDDPAAQAMLALCLARRGQTRQARKVAAEALRLEPDLAFAHAVMASVLLRLDEGRKAEAAAREAIRLDPFEPAHQALLAQVHLQRRAWVRALEAAERGLALDPRHAASATARTAALLQLGRREEAGAAIGATLARDPSDASAHAAQGWARLHAGDAPAALADFREALRLGPTLEPARDGLLNALKAKHPLYRLLLRALLWASRLGPRAHWVVFGGAFIWLNSLQSIARDFPGSRPLLLPLALGYLLFVVSLWAAEPLSTVLLATSRDGRLLLGPRERTAAALLAGIIATTAVVAAAGILAGSTPLFFGGVMLVGLIFPAMALVTAAPGRGRVLLGAAFGALCLVAAAGFALLLAGRGGAAWWPFGVVGLAGMLMAVAHPALMVDGPRAIR